MFGKLFVIVEKGNPMFDFFDNDLVKLSNSRTCTGAFDALRVLEESPANVVTMEMEISEMTGVELIETIHNIDEERKNLT
jgi:two-component SAPR family response regulator|tara:strand:+ start:98 stop:337 length:240 start_codon:yes stop_codon:yes gene_type:complete